jgi:hypothetical protein
MALRDKLAQRAHPYLEPGEQIQAVFLGQTGPSPYWSLLTAWVVILQAGYRTIVVTDRAIVILRNGRLVGSRAKALHLRGPRNIQLGTPSGLWGRVTLDARYWVHKRFHKDVAAADAALAAMSRQQQFPWPAQQQDPGAPPQYPAPGGQQYPGAAQQYPTPGGQQYPGIAEQFPWAAHQQDPGAPPPYTPPGGQPYPQR